MVAYEKVQWYRYVQCIFSFYEKTLISIFCLVILLKSTSLYKSYDIVNSKSNKISLTTFSLMKTMLYCDGNINSIIVWSRSSTWCKYVNKKKQDHVLDSPVILSTQCEYGMRVCPFTPDHSIYHRWSRTLTSSFFTPTPSFYSATIPICPYTTTTMTCFQHQIDCETTFVLLHFFYSTIVIFYDIYRIKLCSCFMTALYENKLVYVVQ